MTFSVVVYGLACLIVGAIAGVFAVALCVPAKGKSNE